MESSLAYADTDNVATPIKEKKKRRASLSERCAREVELSQPPLLQTLSPEASADLLKRSVIRGTPIDGIMPTTKLLEKEGFAPVTILHVDNARFGLSRPYLFVFDKEKEDDARPVVIAYVETEDEETGERHTNVRPFYQSNSQGMWRCTPYHYTYDGKIGHLGKGTTFGMGESSINLPTTIQEALNTLMEKETEKSSLTRRNDPLFFVGLARDPCDERKNPHTAPVPSDMSFKMNVEILPTTVDLVDPHAPPERIALKHIAQAPRFDTGPLRIWKTNMRLYGEVTCETFLSRDQKLLYLFCRDEKGRAWIGGIEDVTTPITSNGVRQRWVNAGALEMPAYEYYDQARGYGNGWSKDDPDPNYTDMFPRYLSKIPLIKRYLKNVKSREKNPAP